MSSGEETVQNPVPSDEVLDASGDPVGEVMQRWLLFIALHLESDNEFSDDDLVDDVLLALGFQDEEERESRSAPGSPYLVRLGDRLQELKDTWLVHRSVDDESGAVRFQVATDIDRIDQAVDALGGSIWAYGDADRMDTETELAWLLIIALRMHSGRLAHDDLLDRLSSFLGRDGSYHEPISQVIQDLERHGLIRFSEGVSLPGIRLRFFDGYRVVGDDHAGLEQLWQWLYQEFGDQPLFVETPVSAMDEFTVASDDQSVDDARSQAALVSPEPAEASMEAEGVNLAIADKQQETPPSSSASTVSAQSLVAQMDLPRGARLQPLDDVDLCIAILRTLEKAFDGPAPSFEDIKKELLNEATIPVEYNETPPPPWVQRIKRSGDRSARRFDSLLEFRLDHALRAMSLHRTGLIRSAEIASEGHHWNLTRAGYEILRKTDNDGKRQLAKQTEDYFDIHSYGSWRTAEWIVEFMDHLTALGKDGMVFEQLCLELLSKVHPDSKVEQSAPNGWLDSNAVDHLVTTIQDLDDEQQAMNRPDSKLLLVQCKRWEANEVDAGQIAKLFASAARFRAQAYNNRELSDIEGARFIYLGSLSHDATWIYWALRDAWEKLDEPASTSGQVENSQPSLLWELWDGAKLFDLIKEHQLGVHVDRSSNAVSIDDAFFDQLKEKVQLRKMFKN